MANILVLYASKFGQTQKISNFICDEILKLGHTATLLSIDDAFRSPIYNDYDSVIIGAPLYGGRFPNAIKKWIKTHRNDLYKRDCAFFAVCLSVLEKDKKTQIELKSRLMRFFDICQWSPQRWQIFAGALNYSKYNFFYKFLLKRILKEKGGDTDSSKDYDYTDWPAVSFFVSEFVRDINLANYSQKKLKSLQSQPSMAQLKIIQN